MAHIVIVGSDKGGTGKTTVTRLVLDYFSGKQRTLRIFDTEQPKPILPRFYPAAVQIDMRHTDGMMAVYDRLDDAEFTVVDIMAGLLTDALASMDDLGLLDAVRAGRHKLTVLHVLGTSVASIGEVADVAKQIPGIQHVLVKNHINAADFAGLDPAVAKQASLAIDIGQLDVTAYAEIDRLGLAYSAFIGSSGSLVQAGLTRSWLKKSFAELAKVFQ